MKVIIFGATGGIGKHAMKYALDKGYDVTAFVRNAAKGKVKADNLKIAEGHIDDPVAVKEALKGQDAVIWCVGIPMTGKYDRMESLEGHKVLLPAMKEAGIKRLIDWGTPSVHSDEDKKSVITVLPGILAGILFKKAKDEMVAIGDALKASDLDWTLVRFMRPKDTPYTGKVKIGYGDVKMRFAISREDIGAFMVEQLENDKYVKSMPIIGS